MIKFIILISFLFMSGCGDTFTLPLGATPLTLRVVERDGIFIVQRYDRLFLIGNWENERKFESKANADNYKNEWLENYRKFKKDQEKIH